MAEPPLEDDAVQVTPMVWLPGVAETMVGAVGTVRGVEELLDDARELPATLVAKTLTEYCVPLVSPEMVQGLDALVQVNELVPSVAVAV